MIRRGLAALCVSVVGVLAFLPHPNLRAQTSGTVDLKMFAAEMRWRPIGRLHWSSPHALRDPEARNGARPRVGSQRRSQELQLTKRAGHDRRIHPHISDIPK